MKQHICNQVGCVPAECLQALCLQARKEMAAAIAKFSTLQAQFLAMEPPTHPTPAYQWPTTADGMRSLSLRLAQDLIWSGGINSITVAMAAEPARELTACMMIQLIDLHLHLREEVSYRGLAYRPTFARYLLPPNVRTIADLAPHILSLISTRRAELEAEQ